MRIVVCVKSVPGSTEVKMDPKTNTIVRDGSQAVVNPFDASALEVALSLKDAADGVATGAPAAADVAAPAADAAAASGPVRVTVLSMGIPDTARLLRDCIARGADDALLLSDRAFAGADTLATTYALSCGVAAMDAAPDLVICGKMAVDGDTAQIGPELAGALGMPCVTDVREIVSCADGTLRARRGADAGIETVEAALPCVITVAREIAQLRMPSIAGVRAGEAAQVRVLTVEGAGADPSRCGLAGSPTQVVRSFVPERAAKAERVEGSAAEQAKALCGIIEGMGL